ncbi:MAG: OsmC family peroxiredoxin [Lachnospiraceae bacterium]|jgi:hypothetical protein|nr:OsmC family peroxiredoxin [Lachnospiraceae bacterium]
MSVRESEIYEKKYRLIAVNNGVKAYNEKISININENISFDSKKEEFSSLDHFVTSIVSDLLIAINKYTKKQGEIIMDLESQTVVIVKNPLSLLNVKGFDEPSYIESIKIKIYLYTFMEEEKAEDYFRNIVSKCLIYNTLKDKLDIKVDFEFTL